MPSCAVRLVLLLSVRKALFFALLSVTAPIVVQLRVCRLQRRGLCARATW